ncbi:MAG: hypothetical protein MZW92_18935 [Comamonadaceae bacterium]|nr:hypothetical protein [Comamonadaceae bacterium]
MREVLGVGVLTASAFAATVPRSEPVSPRPPARRLARADPRQAQLPAARPGSGDSSRRGDAYLRTLPVQGARSALQGGPGRRRPTTGHAPAGAGSRRCTCARRATTRRWSRSPTSTRASRGRLLVRDQHFDPERAGGGIRAAAAGGHSSDTSDSQRRRPRPRAPEPTSTALRPEHNAAEVRPSAGNTPANPLARTHAARARSARRRVAAQRTGIPRATRMRRACTASTTATRPLQKPRRPPPADETTGATGAQ